MNEKCRSADWKMAVRITRDASHQTYYTVRFLVDGQLKPCAYQAYAYFRWLDDHLDTQVLAASERLAFISRQKILMEELYHGKKPASITPEENLLVELIQCDTDHNSGLRTYIRSMMKVMAFDASRRGSLISHRELSNYTRLLATAVTEALHYFIGNDTPGPYDGKRYYCAAAAHITHMLRDSAEDVRAGYYNIPANYLQRHSLEPQDIHNTIFRHWVRNRVELARRYFQLGREHLSQVPNLRCRIAGYAYTMRFEQVLDTIESDGFVLRPEYEDLCQPRDMALLSTRALVQALRFRGPDKGLQAGAIQ